MQRPAFEFVSWNDTPSFGCGQGYRNFGPACRQAGFSFRPFVPSVLSVVIEISGFRFLEETARLGARG